MEKHIAEAAERGDAEAQFNLGIICENGALDSRYVIEGSQSEAVRWFRAAAEQGLARAQVKLGDIFAAEPDGSLDACKWYLLAARGLRGGHLQAAQSAYRRAAVHLTPTQAAEVSRFVQNWSPKAPLIATTPGALETSDRALT